MGKDRTRNEEPGREMEGDTVMTRNTRDNNNQKEPISFKILLFLFTIVAFIEGKMAKKLSRRGASGERQFCRIRPFASHLYL